MVYLCNIYIINIYKVKRNKVDHIISEEINRYLQNEIRAYHGSGAGFDKFSNSFNGTGEGSSSFGPGMYFTSSKQIGHDYAFQHGDKRLYFKLKSDKLAKWLPDNMVSYITTDILPHRIVDDKLYLNIVDTIAKLQQTVTSKNKFIRLITLYVIKIMKNVGIWNYHFDDDEDTCFPYQDKVDDLFEWLNDNVEENNRYLYQVELPDDKYFLDWNGIADEGFINNCIKYANYCSDKRAIGRFKKYLKEYDPHKITYGNVYKCLENAFFSESDSNFVWKCVMDKYGYKGLKYPAGQNFSTTHTKPGDINYTVLNNNDVKTKKRWDY